MDPRKIASLLTEDIYENSGMLLCEQTEVMGSIPLDDIKDMSSYPIVADIPKGTAGMATFVVLPPLRGMNQGIIERYYLALQALAQENGGEIDYIGQQAGYYGGRPINKRVVPYAEAKDDIGFAADLVHEVNTFSIQRRDYTPQAIKELLAGQRRGDSNWDPFEWERALDQHAGGLVIESKDMPSLFAGYKGMENQHVPFVMLVSGKYADGLYIVPTELRLVPVAGAEVTEEVLPWAEACEKFSDNPEAYWQPKQQPKHMFRKYLTGTKQGLYINRWKLSPADTVKLFRDSESLDAFIRGYNVHAEFFERTGSVII